MVQADVESAQHAWPFPSGLFFGRRLPWCSTAALMKALNSGWPSQGVDLNSGWNCTPMNQGARCGSSDDFGQVLALRQGRNHQARLAQLVQVVHVGFVAVAVALGHHVAIDAMGQGAGCTSEIARPGAWCRPGRSWHRAS